MKVVPERLTSRERSDDSEESSRTCSSEAVRVVTSRSFYLRFVLWFGAGFSFLDMLSDIYMINLYLSSSQGSYAIATITSCCICILLQLVIVHFQHRKESWLQYSVELLAYVICVKPGLDVYRVASGATSDKILVPYIDEMNMVRAIELFTEALPGAIIQLLAIVAGKHHGAMPVLSLLSCLCSASFISACLSYEKDTDPKSRASAPYFYGFIPLDRPGKVKVFLCTFLMSTFQISARAFACALCLTSDTAMFLMAVFAADVGAFFLYKLLRKGERGRRAKRKMPALTSGTRHLICFALRRLLILGARLRHCRMRYGVQSAPNDQGDYRLHRTDPLSPPL